MADIKPINKQENPEGSLIFEDREKAEQFLEKIEEKVESRTEKDKEIGEQQKKEIIKQALAEELKKYGPEPIEFRKGEWQYTESDRENVQKYVNIAFSTNLKRATSSLMRTNENDNAAQLRTMDLFHDTLADHLYDELVKRDMLPSSKTYSDVMVLTLAILFATIAAIIILTVALLK